MHSPRKQATNGCKDLSTTMAYMGCRWQWWSLVAPSHPPTVCTAVCTTEGTIVTFCTSKFTQSTYTNSHRIMWRKTQAYNSSHISLDWARDPTTRGKTVGTQYVRRHLPRGVTVLPGTLGPILLLLWRICTYNTRIFFKQNQFSCMIQPRHRKLFRWDTHHFLINPHHGHPLMSQVGTIRSLATQPPFNGKLGTQFKWKSNWGFAKDFNKKQKTGAREIFLQQGPPPKFQVRTEYILALVEVVEFMLNSQFFITRFWSSSARSPAAEWAWRNKKKGQSK